MDRPAEAAFVWERERRLRVHGAAVARRRCVERCGIAGVARDRRAHYARRVRVHSAKIAIATAGRVATCKRMPVEVRPPLSDEVNVLAIGTRPNRYGGADDPQMSSEDVGVAGVRGCQAR